jgi:rod shape determining protein RodA
MQRGRDIRKNIDWLSIGIYAALVICGWIAIYSASFSEAHPEIWDMGMPYGKQLLWMGICSLVALFTLNIEGEFFNRFSPIIYLSVTIMLVLVLLIGKKVGGARSWFAIGSFAIQPSEFAKMATGLFLAYFINTSGVKFKSFSNRLQVFGIVAIPAGLILLQPDAGTVLVFLGFIFAMYREGLSGNILIIGFASLILGVVSIIMGANVVDYPWFGEQSGIFYVGIGILALAALGFLGVKLLVLPRNRKRTNLIVLASLFGALIFSGGVYTGIEQILKPHQKERIYILFGLEVNNPDADYNIRHAKAAIGSGGWRGKGVLEGPMTRYNFVPEQNTDFIFCTIGEEWGFIGSVFVLVLFATLILRLLFLAERQRSQFSRVYGYCVASILFMHVLINVGMVIGLAPVIGIPLPFFSYGGSSLLGFTLLIFIMLRLDSERFSVFR